MNNIDLDRSATKLLIALGFTPKNIGFYYLRDALVMTAADPTLLQLITKNLYPDLAARFHTKASDVERAIRFTSKEWFLTKIPGTKLQTAEIGEITVPETSPSNMKLLKLLSIPLRKLHISPSLQAHHEYDAPPC